jgi:hypothetical protein
MYQPVSPLAPLIRSLYGHPLASASWQNHLSNILSTHLGGYELEEQPSCFHFPALNLALSVYVDDLTLSGPKKNHSQFWSTLRKHVQLEDPAELSKVLGRNHVPQDQGVLHCTRQILPSSVSSFMNSSQARKSNTFALLTAIVEPLLNLMMDV